MANEKLPQIIEDLLYAEERRLLDDDVGEAIKRVIHAGVADDLIRGFLHERVRRTKIQEVFAGPFPIPHLKDGDLILGKDQHGAPILVPFYYFNEPSLNVGSTGSGKTTREKFMVLQVGTRVKGLWLPDFVKREFAALKPLFKRLGINLIIAPARMWRFNPLQVPEHTNPRDYAPNISEVLVRTLILPPRATKLLHSTILNLYEEFGIFEGATYYPTLFDLRESIARNREANPQAREAIIDSIDPVLLSLKNVLCYRYGWTTTALARHHIGFEFGGVSETDKNVLFNSLVMGEFISRISRNISNPMMDLYICCDEAARLVGKEDSSISNMIGLIRGTGIGLDLSVQSAQVAPSIFSNTPNKFIGRCTNAADYSAVGSSIGLTHEQCRWLAMNLVPGTFLGHLGQGSWRFPFLFRVPKLNFRQHDYSEEHGFEEEGDDGDGDLGALKSLPAHVAREFV